MIIAQPSVTLADPHICSDAKNRLNILSHIFDALVQRDMSGRFVPAIASSWTVAADARHWRFELRQDVHFHNGATMTSADVVASLKRAIGPEVGGELGTEGVWASYIGDAEIEPAGSHTVTITTTQPMADLLDLLVAIPIIPQNALNDIPNTLVGSGPYLLRHANIDEVALDPFANAVIRQPIFNEPIIWRRVANSADRVAAVRNGQVQLATDLSAAEILELEAAGQQSLAHESNMCVAFLFNLINGAAADPRLRQAINHAVNVERMIEQAHGGAAQPLNGPLTPLHFGCDPDVEPYAYDPDKAKQLIAESGFDSVLKIDAPTTLPNESPLLCELMVEDLKAVGLEVEVTFYEDRPAYAHMVKAKQIADICCFDSSPLSSYRVLREKINSDVAGPWWQGYSNASVNQLLDQAATVTDDDERQKVYREAYGIMADEAPWIFLYRPTYLFGVAAGIDGITVGPDGRLRLGASS